MSFCVVACWTSDGVCLSLTRAVIQVGVGMIIATKVAIILNAPTTRAIALKPRNGSITNAQRLATAMCLGIKRAIQVIFSAGFINSVMNKKAIFQCKIHISVLFFTYPYFT